MRAGREEKGLCRRINCRGNIITGRRDESDEVVGRLRVEQGGRT